ncbi:chromate transporter [Pseudomonas aeruginosa]
MGLAYGAADRPVWLGGHPDPDGVVLYQGRSTHLRRRCHAVLPYVYQGAVGHRLADYLQMIDGLALGETTPGPLIMVVAFVGFVGAYVHQVFGPEQAFLAGAVAASLVTWFTFLPSFLFILAGGPLVESTHNELEVHRSVDRHYCRGGRRHPQPRAVLRLSVPGPEGFAGSSTGPRR